MELKQIVQNARTGKLELACVPAPAVTSGCVLVRNHFSVVSPGLRTRPWASRPRAITRR